MAHGQKFRFSKFALWELACRVPFLVAGPGIEPGVINAPVSLLDIYPTLVAQCGLRPPSSHKIEGVDLSATLARRTEGRGRPVLSVMGPGDYSLRDERFRYIRYENGDEELYDHLQDPHEWNNLAPDSRFAVELERLAGLLPENPAEEIYETNWSRRWKAWKQAPMRGYPDTN